ncbi:AzlD domain-containing protein [Demequina sp.]|uniref:AzlD domain-containing protein n=1 Tax=Demequina sp. TaxID=2050685 RepID=UPI003D0E3DB7
MNIWWIFLFAAIGTYLIRISGVVLLRDPERIPAPIRRALTMVGPAAMGAIIVNSLFLDHGEWRAFGAWHIAAAVAIGVALWRRSQGWSMLAGALTFAALIATAL